MTSPLGTLTVRRPFCAFTIPALQAVGGASSAMTLGATAAQLFSMFEFKGKPPPGQQSISEVNGLVRLLCDHCSGMTVSTFVLQTWNNTS